MNRPQRNARSAAALAAAAALLMPLAGQGIGGGLQVEDARTEVHEKLGQFVPGDVALADETGRAVRSGDWFTGRRPIVLNLGYFGCPRVCGAVLNGLLTGLAELDMRPGEHYDLVTVSFDGREQPELAAAKKAAFAEAFPALPLSSWRLHTGTQAEVDRLCASVGFGYAWNEHTKDFDHRAVTVFLSPDGKVSRYLYGYDYDRRDLRFAVLESAEGKVGSFAERLLVSCYGYDPQTRQYRVLAIAVMQVGGVATLIGLSLLLFAMWRYERRSGKRGRPGSAALQPREVTP